MSSNGKLILVKYDDSTIEIIAYVSIDKKWTQLGSFTGLSYEGFGSSMDINYEGNVIAAGSVQENTTNRRGIVKVYKFLNDSWTQMGSSIQGEIGEEMGKSCKLNLSGDVVAFGSNLRTNIVGKVKIYSFNGTSWTQLGSTLLQLASDDGFGSNLTLSYNAQTLVVGSHSVMKINH